MGPGIARDCIILCIAQSNYQVVWDAGALQGQVLALLRWQPVLRVRGPSTYLKNIDHVPGALDVS